MKQKKASGTRNRSEMAHKPAIMLLHIRKKTFSIPFICYCSTLKHTDRYSPHLPIKTMNVLKEREKTTRVKMVQQWNNIKETVKLPIKMVYINIKMISSTC